MADVKLSTPTTIDASPILNQIISIATGKTPEDTGIQASNLISIGNKVLHSRYNEFVTAMSQVMSYTVFKAERPYRRKYQRMIRTSDRWGNHVRKIGMLSRDFIGDGQWSSNPWNDENMFNTAPEDEAFQTNYYGKDHYELPWKIYKNQLDNAMRSMGEFNSYYSMQLQTINNDWEQGVENYSRQALNNLIGGVLQTGGDFQKVNLLKEYNDANGTSFTVADIHKKENYTDFVRFAYAKIKTYMEYMTERTINFHIPFVNDDSELLDMRRATPKEYQNLYILTNEYEEINARVLAETFNPEYINSDLFERVNYWETMKEPDKIHNGGACVLPTGNNQSYPVDAHATKSIYAVLFDDECIGVNTFDEWTATSPLEAHRGYWANYWHTQVRYWNSFEDNAVVFYLEDGNGKKETK